ncbi:MAG: universal stress protein, partial [Acidobacteria bacterium]|nr:universal stress protein [Acidobacteriota bacterium]
GALEIVIATVALSLGVFSDTAYTVIVIVPMVTSVFASFSLRLAVRGWRGSPDEQERLDREEVLSRNVVVKNSRLLLPSRGGPASIGAAQVAHFAWPPESAVTVMSVTEKGSEGVDIEVLRNVFFDREVEHKQVNADDPAAAIIAEAGLGYGALIIGVAVAHHGQLLSPTVDEIIRQSPVPVVIVRRARNLDRPLPAAFSRALVPVGGGRSSRAAQEVAFGISNDLGTDLVLTHVVNKHQALHVPSIFGRMRADEPSAEVANTLLSQAVARADELGLSATTDVRHGASTGTELVRAATEVEADVVVIGASIRNVDGRPYLGHSAETVLEQCDATVVVVATRTLTED